MVQCSVLTAQGLEDVDGGGSPATVKSLEAHRDGSDPRAEVEDNNGVDDVLARVLDAQGEFDEVRAPRRPSARLAGSGCVLGADEQVPENVVGHPPRELLDVADPGDDLNDASCEVGDERLRVWQVPRGRSLAHEQRVCVDEFAGPRRSR